MHGLPTNASELHGATNASSGPLNKYQRAMRGSMSGLAGSSRTGSSLGQLIGSAGNASGPQHRVARRSFGGSNHAVMGGNSDENYSSHPSHESYSGGKKANAS